VKHAFRVPLTDPQKYGTDISASRGEALNRAQLVLNDELARKGCPVTVLLAYLDCEHQLAIVVEWPDPK
jgi:hypothetical protein